MGLDAGIAQSTVAGRIAAGERGCGSEPGGLDDGGGPDNGGGGSGLGLPIDPGGLDTDGGIERVGGAEHGASALDRRRGMACAGADPGGGRCGATERDLPEAVPIHMWKVCGSWETSFVASGHRPQ